MKIVWKPTKHREKTPKRPIRGGGGSGHILSFYCLLPTAIALASKACWDLTVSLYRRLSLHGTDKAVHLPLVRVLASVFPWVQDCDRLRKNVGINPFNLRCLFAREHVSVVGRLSWSEQLTYTHGTVGVRTYFWRLQCWLHCVEVQSTTWILMHNWSQWWYINDA